MLTHLRAISFSSPHTNREQTLCLLVSNKIRKSWTFEPMWTRNTHTLLIFTQKCMPTLMLNAQLTFQQKFVKSPAIYYSTPCNTPPTKLQSTSTHNSCTHFVIKGKLGQVADPESGAIFTQTVRKKIPFLPRRRTQIHLTMSPLLNVINFHMYTPTNRHKYMCSRHQLRGWQWTHVLPCHTRLDTETDITLENLWTHPVKV